MVYSLAYSVLPNSQIEHSHLSAPQPDPSAEALGSVSEHRRAHIGVNLLSRPDRSSNNKVCRFNWNICLWISKLIYFDTDLFFGGLDFLKFKFVLLSPLKFSEPVFFFIINGATFSL